MAAVDGSWEILVKTPLGEQKGTLTVKSDGGNFTGNLVGTMGSADISDGTIDGNALHWTMAITVPMPLTLDSTATVDGDAITGSVGAGAFGSFPLSGSRVA